MASSGASPRYALIPPTFDQHWFSYAAPRVGLRWAERGDGAILSLPERSVGARLWRARLLVVGAVFIATGAWPVYGGDCFDATDRCTVPCPAANSCRGGDGEFDCDPGEICVPRCLPSVCYCDGQGWACTADCAGECGLPRTVTEFAKITPSDGFPMAFGASIAVSGDDLVVGAPGYITEEGVVGTAYVFHRVGPRWVEIGKLLPALGGIDDEDFGLTVAIDGEYIVVGAPHIIAGVIGGGGYGRAFIFSRDDRGTPDDPLDDQWWQDAEFRSPDEIRFGDMFASSVAISDGVVLIGKPGSTSDMAGSAYLYRNVNELWRHVASLNPSDSALGDRFGNAVSLDGPLALVGAWLRSDNGTRTGAAYLFRQIDGLWLEEQKLAASDAAPFDFFGSSVSIAGEHAVVGAYADDDGGATSGSAYAFTQFEGYYSSEQKLVASDAAPSDAFGQALATDGNIVIVGGPGKESNAGSAYLFFREADEWIEAWKFVTSDRSRILGVSVAVNVNYAFASADEAVYIYVLPIAAKNLRDFSTFQLCFRGEERGLATECADFDLAPDGRIDLRDFNEFLATLAGP